ncbi:hypothetical protein M885DRAFT_549290 [Pelagophyceae sp. CCMP2097]|nr:hypothetical protein M885DRAFT_549290 [Pelagophyceae sp. CCMP2097]
MKATSNQLSAHLESAARRGRCATHRARGSHRLRGAPHHQAGHDGPLGVLAKGAATTPSRQGPRGGGYVR